MAIITADDLIKFTGTTGDNVKFQAEQAITVAVALVGAYCRGREKRGGRYRPGVEAVITTVAARILANPDQVQEREQIGPYSFFKGDGFKGFTIVELAVLNRYRKRGI